MKLKQQKLGSKKWELVDFIFSFILTNISFSKKPLVLRNFQDYNIKSLFYVLANPR